MCGIAGVLNRKNKNIVPVLIKMLKNLEYRGYDSCGFATIIGKNLIIKKGVGKIDEVVKTQNIMSLVSNIGIAHTRWATHGSVTNANAHPHFDCKKSIAVVHNGIIENYAEIREELISKGHKFLSETDTEVIPHLIEHYYKETNDILEAIKNAVGSIRGTYAFALLTLYEPDRLFFAKNGQPLILGVNAEEVYLASDIPAFLEFTQKAIVLRDGDIGYVSHNSRYITNILNPALPPPKIIKVPWTPEQAQKGGYEHFMLKEIFEQPDALKRTIIMVSKQINNAVKLLKNANNIYLTAAGTSFYASLYGQYLFANFGIKATAIISSEFISLTKEIIEPGDVIIAISQSGETFDTLNAVRFAKNKNAKIIGIVNTLESSLMRISHIPIVMGAGPEIGVAATKTFSCQVTSLILLASEYMKAYNYDTKNLEDDLKLVPDIIGSYLKEANYTAKKVAEILKNKNHAFYLGRGLGYPIALEGALKLKEIAYIHAESYPAGESKHGPIALVEKNFPIVEIILRDENYDHMITSIQEMKARGGFIIAVYDKNDKKLDSLADFKIRVPSVSIYLSPLVYVIPLQLIAYNTAVIKGYNPDKPRNLAKSVTVA
ncbi:MAG: glutamine--fructose-6-phosphate transaminase (isomerizing) [Candidatus Njordarchaeota archaeon]